MDSELSTPMKSAEGRCARASCAESSRALKAVLNPDLMKRISPGWKEMFCSLMIDWRWVNGMICLENAEMGILFWAAQEA